MQIWFACPSSNRGSADPWLEKLTTLPLSLHFSQTSSCWGTAWQMPTILLDIGLTLHGKQMITKRGGIPLPSKTLQVRTCELLVGIAPRSENDRPRCDNQSSGTSGHGVKSISVLRHGFRSVLILSQSTSDVIYCQMQLANLAAQNTACQRVFPKALNYRFSMFA